MSFSDHLNQLKAQVQKLSAIMDEVEALEEQKLAVLGFDQDNVLESDVSGRFQHQVQLLHTTYQILQTDYKSELGRYHPNPEEEMSQALQAFRAGEAETAHFWDLFGE